MFHNYVSLFIEKFIFSVANYFAHKTTDWKNNQTFSKPCKVQRR